MIISYGDNLILIDLDASYTHEMPHSRIKFGNLLVLAKNRNPDNNNDSRKTYLTQQI